MNLKRTRFYAKTLFVGLMAVSVLAGCKKEEGCTDDTAINYNPDAEKDDGSCEYAPYTVTDVTVGGTTYKQVTGTINENYTFTAGSDWMLSGGVFVDANATLTIEAGVTVYAADDGTVPFLSVLRGGDINAVGTASNPIVFTPVKANPAAGDWGGIIINGYADINVGETAEGEGGTGTYGGTYTADNSGTLKYVRVEYAGKILGTDNELNGFSFNGVGTGTTLEYLQAYRGADDGFEFFGGNAKLKYAVSTGNDDDSFDWTHGWRGNGQFWVVNQATEGGDRGIEADNNGDDNTLAPYSYPTISNITFIGANDGDGENTGMRLREGTKGLIYNALVTNFPKNGVRVSDATTTANMDGGSLQVRNSYVWNNGTDWKDCDPFMNHSTNASTDPAVLSGYVGTVATGAKDPSTINSWFSAGNYIGAVPTGSDWTAGWTKAL